MSKFVDVQPYHWFYNQVEDIADLALRDGRKFLYGIYYNAFQEGKQAVDFTYAEKTAHSEKVVDFIVSTADDNPLLAFVDGISVAIDDVTPNTTNGSTYIKYRRMIPANATVRLIYGGEPQLAVRVIGDSASMRPSPDISTFKRTVYFDEWYDLISSDGVWFKVKDGIDEGYIYSDDNVTIQPSPIKVIGGSTIKFPSADLNITGDFQYVYNPFYERHWEDISSNGQQLKRVENSSLIKESNEYAIENGKIYVHYNLNNSTVEGTVLTTYQGVTKPKYIKLRPYSDNILYQNRFFPDIEIPRVDFISLLNRLRINFYEKFSDSSAPKSTRTTSRFADVQAELDKPGDPPWWWEDFRDLESLQFPGGGYLFNGVGNNNFGIHKTITRAECAAILNRFRKLMVEAFK